jgi:hypothetical protein
MAAWTAMERSRRSTAGVTVRRSPRRVAAPWAIWRARGMHGQWREELWPLRVRLHELDERERSRHVRPERRRVLVPRPRADRGGPTATATRTTAARRTLRHRSTAADAPRRAPARARCARPCSGRPCASISASARRNSAARRASTRRATSITAETACTLARTARAAWAGRASARAHARVRGGLRRQRHRRVRRPVCGVRHAGGRRWRHLRRNELRSVMPAGRTDVLQRAERVCEQGY